MDTRPRSVHSGMYQEAGRIQTATLVATDYFPIQVDENLVTGVQQARVDAERVGLESLGYSRSRIEMCPEYPLT